MENNKNDLLFSKTWKANVRKSQFSTKWSPDIETRIYEKLDNGYTLTVSGSHGGKPYNWGYTAYYDGKPYPVSGRKDVDSIIAYRVTNLITIGFLNNASEPVGGYARFVSEDGKSLIVHTSGRNETGEAYFDVIHYEL